MDRRILHATLIRAAALAALLLGGCASIDASAFPPFFAPSLGTDASAWTMRISRPDSPESLGAKRRMDRRSLAAGDLLESVQTACWVAAAPARVEDGDNPCQSVDAIEALPAWHMPRPPERYLAVVLRETRASGPQGFGLHQSHSQTRVAVFDMEPLVQGRASLRGALEVTVPSLDDPDASIAVELRPFDSTRLLLLGRRHALEPAPSIRLATLPWANAIDGVARAILAAPPG